MPRSYPTLIIVAGLFLTWQALLAAGEPQDLKPDGAAVEKPAPMSRKFQVAIRFVGPQKSLSAPKVRLRDGQTASVFDQSQSPFVIGETVTFGIKSPAIRVVTEGTSIDVKATSTDSANHVLLDLSAEQQKIDEVAQNGAYQSVRIGSVIKQVLKRVKLGEKTFLDFADLQLEVVVTAAN